MFVSQVSIIKSFVIATSVLATVLKIAVTLVVITIVEMVKLLYSIKKHYHNII